jgi:hypothetical protein
MGSAVLASPQLVLVSALLECRTSTISVMTHHLMFARLPHLKRLEIGVHLLRHRRLVSFYVLALPCHRGPDDHFTGATRPPPLENLDEDLENCLWRVSLVASSHFHVIVLALMTCSL